MLPPPPIRLKATELRRTRALLARVDAHTLWAFNAQAPLAYRGRMGPPARSCTASQNGATQTR